MHLLRYLILTGSFSVFDLSECDIMSVLLSILIVSVIWSGMDSPDWTMLIVCVRLLARVNL